MRLGGGGRCPSCRVASPLTFTTSSVLVSQAMGLLWSTPAVALIRFAALLLLHAAYSGWEGAPLPLLLPTATLMLPFHSIGIRQGARYHRSTNPGQPSAGGCTLAVPQCRVELMEVWDRSSSRRCCLWRYWSWEWRGVQHRSRISHGRARWRRGELRLSPIMRRC